MSRRRTLSDSPLHRITACPICGGASLVPFGRRTDGVAVLQCEHCRMAFAQHRPAEPLRLYGDDYYRGDGSTASGYDDYGLVAAHSLAWAVELVRLLRPAGRILDVGCADGHLLRALGSGYEPYGIEANERMLAGCERAGIRMIGRDAADPLLRRDWSGRFDVITAIAVLEHVADLRGTLEQLRELLAPGGLLIFETPLMSPTRDNGTWYRSSLEHIFYPTLEGLDYLFRRVFSLPVIGRELPIQGYASTFVGVATRGAKRHQQLAARFAYLVDTPIAALELPPERAFRFFFDVVHAAQATPAHAAVLAELPLDRLSRPLLHRLSELWRNDLERASSMAASLSAQVFRSARVETELSRHLEESSERRRKALDLQEQASAAKLRTATRQLAAEHGKNELARFKTMVKRAEARVIAAEAEEAHAQERAGALQHGLADAQQRAGQLDAELQALRAELAARETRLRALLDSTSWRLMAPLRWTARAAKAAIHKPLRPGGKPWRLARSLWRLAPLGAPVKHRLIAELVRRGALVPAQPQQLPAATEPTGGVARALRQEAWPSELPLVSVVIPCFNYGRFVATAVDSVLAQTFQDFEVLVVDGGSESPESVAGLRAIERPRTTVYWRDGSHLVGDNRNFGIARARGKYVCCLDADDLLRPTYLEKALFLLEGEGYDLVSTSYQCFGDDSSIFQIAEHPTLADMVAANHVATCAVFRRELWEQAGGFRDTGRGADYIYEDWRLWIRLAALGARIANLVGEPLFAYRVHRSSLSRGAAVPPIATQREAILALEADVVNEAAYTRSEERRRERVIVERPLLNLDRGPRDGPPTILIAAPFLLVGGVERLLSVVVAHLQERGFRVIITTSVHFDPSFGDSSDWFASATAEIYHLPRFLAPGRWRDFLFHLLESKRVRLVWVVGSSVLYDLLPEIKAKYPRIKVLDSLFNTVGHTANNRKHCRAIDLNLVENLEVEEWMRQAGEPPERVRLIPSGVDLSRYRPEDKPPAALQALGIPADAFVVGFSGRLAEEKRPDWFVKIAHRLRDDPRFVFLMTGAGPLEADVRKRIARLRLEDRLHFLGRVPEVTEYLRLYDVLVLPSRLDGRPVVVLESLAMGVPVIASRVGGLPELVRDGETGFLCAAADRQAFVDRILWLADHRDEHRRMKAAARRFAEAELSATRMLAEYERAVTDVLGMTLAPTRAAENAEPESSAEGSALEHDAGDDLGAHRHAQAEELPHS